MRKNITIGDKDIVMVGNAATPFRFKNIFKKDLLKIFVSADGEADNVSEQIEASQMLAYVMTMQAEGVDMNKLTEESFYSWLEEFSSMDLYNALDDIVGLWQASQVTTSKPKK